MKLPKISDSENVEIYINPDRVTFIRAYGEDLTIIYFGENHRVIAKSVPSAVASALFNAGKL